MALYTDGRSDGTSLPPGTMAVVKGGGELGTAVALALANTGWRVVVAELLRPTVLRRQLSLAEAAFSGIITREGMRAVRVTRPADSIALLREPGTIPLYVGCYFDLLDILRPALVVDARMLRSVAPARQRHEAALVIGLGPNLSASEDVDAVIETYPGPDLGRVLSTGTARPHAPLPRSASGFAEEYVRAPSPGVWHTMRTIGDTVSLGDAIGTLDDTVLTAPIGGCIRGLVHDAVPAPAGLKVAAIHPGDWRRKEAGISQRAETVARAVLALAGARVSPQARQEAAALVVAP